MVTDHQVRKLMTLIPTTSNLELAAEKAGMCPRTARKYRKIQKLPSECKLQHDWRTRPDPFKEVWEEIVKLLEVNHGLQAKTIFEDFQRKHPGKFPDGQLRSLQRRLKNWRAISGPPKEVFFPQLHIAGDLCQSDFTEMNSLGITIQGEFFRHLFYHLVLTYSNRETGSICFSESFESLSVGFQKAIFELGGVPRIHQTDRLSAAVNNMNNLAEFTERYQGLLRHYGTEGRRGNAGRGNENGDVEQRHHRFKVAVDQELMLRGSRDFNSRSAYESFLRSLLVRLNQNRSERFLEEVKVLKPLHP
ncbi:MAG: IS21 family transposase [Candidatus Riflebacteria bacterium]|nr:IS21 family transposase [Candidatus Riflebacteria bacterium]